MMSILEYAGDVNKTVEEIMGLCDRLNIKYESDESLLTEDDIVLLDGEIELSSEEEFDEDEVLDVQKTGAIVEFDIQVTNILDKDAKNVIVKQVLPEEVSFDNGFILLISLVTSVSIPSRLVIIQHRIVSSNKSSDASAGTLKKCFNIGIASDEIAEGSERL